MKPTKLSSASITRPSIPLAVTKAALFPGLLSNQNWGYIKQTIKTGAEKGLGMRLVLFIIFLMQLNAHVHLLS